MFKVWKQNRAYNRARLRIIRHWRQVDMGNTMDAYSSGYYAGMDRAVRIIAEELGRK